MRERSMTALNADITIEARIRGDRDRRLQAALDLLAFNERRHVPLADIALVVGLQKTYVYVIGEERQ